MARGVVAAQELAQIGMHQEIELGLAAFVKVGFHEQEAVAAKRGHIELAQLQNPIEALGECRVIELLVPVTPSGGLSSDMVYTWPPA